MTSARSLSLVAALAAPIFLAAAVAGWLYGVWPATPLTFAVAAVVVTGGPLLAIYHVASADRAWQPEDEPTLALPVPAAPPAPEPVVLTPRAAAARAFVNWRDTPNAAIDHRDRDRRANAYITNP